MRLDSEKYWQKIANGELDSDQLFFVQETSLQSGTSLFVINLAQASATNQLGLPPGRYMNDFVMPELLMGAGNNLNLDEQSERCLAA